MEPARRQEDSRGALVARTSLGWVWARKPLFTGLRDQEPPSPPVALCTAKLLGEAHYSGPHQRLVVALSLAVSAKLDKWVA